MKRAPSPATACSPSTDPKSCAPSATSAPSPSQQPKTDACRPIRTLFPRTDASTTADGWMSQCFPLRTSLLAIFHGFSERAFRNPQASQAHIPTDGVIQN